MVNTIERAESVADWEGLLSKVRLAASGVRYSDSVVTGQGLDRHAASRRCRGPGTTLHAAEAELANELVIFILLVDPGCAPIIEPAEASESSTTILDPA